MRGRMILAKNLDTKSHNLLKAAVNLIRIQILILILILLEVLLHKVLFHQSIVHVKREQIYVEKSLKNLPVQKGKDVQINTVKIKIERFMLIKWI